MNTLEEQLEVGSADNHFAILHSNWLRDPVTKQALKLIKEHSERCSRSASAQSMTTSIDSEAIRRINVAAYTADTVLTFLSQTSEFVKQSNK